MRKGRKDEERGREQHLGNRAGRVVQWEEGGTVGGAGETVTAGATVQQGGRVLGETDRTDRKRARDRH